MSFTMRATVVLFQSSYFYCNLKSVKSIIFPLNFPFKLSAIVVLCQSNLHFFMLFYQFNISRQVVVLYPHIFHSFPQLTKLFHWRESMWLKSIWNKIVLQNFRWCSVSFIIFRLILPDGCLLSFNVWNCWQCGLVYNHLSDGYSEDS